VIILDTNVISEPLKPRPNEAVIAWLDTQAIEVLYVTAVTVSELFYGAEQLPAGKRKSKLISDLAALLKAAIGSRLLPFDEDAAYAHVQVLLKAEALGSVLPRNASFIAAIAHSRGYSVATQDTEPFVTCGVQVVNPWQIN
jgi:predicted nucleic acid-binding protein